MAKTQNKTQKRIKILEKLITLGIKTEEDVKKLTTKDIAKDETITLADIPLICELQECVKNNRLYSFLAEGIEVI